MSIQANCCCGAVSIELAGESKLNAVCHCKDCRKRTGSAFGHSLYFPREALTQTAGSVNTYSVSNEGGEQKRHFCPHCGTTLYWYWERFPEWVGVAGGCLSDEAPSPTISACHDRALKWVAIPESWSRY